MDPSMVDDVKGPGRIDAKALNIQESEAHNLFTTTALTDRVKIC